MTRENCILLTVCAGLRAKNGDLTQAETELRTVKTLADRFDAAPEYGMHNLKFYHGKNDAVAYDDFGKNGESTLQAVEAFLRKDELGQPLMPLWEVICHEA